MRQHETFVPTCAQPAIVRLQICIKFAAAWIKSPIFIHNVFCATCVCTPAQTGIRKHNIPSFAPFGCCCWFCPPALPPQLTTFLLSPPSPSSTTPAPAHRLTAKQELLHGGCGWRCSLHQCLLSEGAHSWGQSPLLPYSFSSSSPPLSVSSCAVPPPLYLDIRIPHI